MMGQNFGCVSVSKILLKLYNDRHQAVGCKQAAKKIVINLTFRTDFIMRTLLNSVYFVEFCVHLNMSTIS